MEITELLKKAATEVLSDVEKAELGKFDLNAHINGIVAKEKKKLQDKVDEATKVATDAAAKVAEYEAKLAEKANEGKSEVEKLLNKVKSLEGAFNAEKQARADAEAKAAQAERNRKVDALMPPIIPGIDGDAMTNVFRGYLADVDLDDQIAVEAKVKEFTEKNKAAIVDASGNGSGTRPADASVQVGRSGKPIDKMSADERQKDLADSGLL